MYSACLILVALSLRYSSTTQPVEQEGSTLVCSSAAIFPPEKITGTYRVSTEAVENLKYVPGT